MRWPCGDDFIKYLRSTPSHSRSFSKSFEITPIEYGMCKVCPCLNTVCVYLILTFDVVHWRDLKLKSGLRRGHAK